jgi:hypothetical protein
MEYLPYVQGGNFEGGGSLFSTGSGAFKGRAAAKYIVSYCLILLTLFIKKAPDSVGRQHGCETYILDDVGLVG